MLMGILRVAFCRLLIGKGVSLMVVIVMKMMMMVIVMKMMKTTVKRNLWRESRDTLTSLHQRY